MFIGNTNMKEKFNEEAVMKEILELTKKSRVVTTSEVADSLKISWNTAEKYLLEWAIQGKIERLKKAGVNLWVIK
jgi:Mn-dependent DtxR family transcriptional regulator